MNSFKLITVVAAIVALTACGKREDFSQIPTVNYQGQVQQAPMQQAPVQPQMQPQVQPQQPVVINNEQSSVMPALLGAAAGYMLGSNMNRGNPQSQSRVVEREVIREAPSNYPRGLQQRNTASVIPAPTPAPAVVPKPTAPVAPKFAPVPTPRPQAVIPPPPKPSFSQGGYSSVRQSTPSFSSRPSGRR